MITRPNRSRPTLACRRTRGLFAAAFRLFGIAAALYVSVPAAWALDPSKAVTQYALASWQREQGLPQDSVQAIVQTRDGYLWLGTQGGIARFDGHRFVSFDKSNTPGLLDDDVRALVEARDGSLWIGTYNGGLSRMTNGRMTSFTTKDGLSSNMIRGIHEDREGNLWIGTYGGGLNRLRNGKFTVFTKKDGLPHDSIRPILEDRQGNVWIGTYGGGLSRFRDGRFTNFTAADSLTSNVVYALLEDRAGSLWIGTYGGGLMRLTDGKFESWSVSDGLPDDRVLDLLEDRDGNLWIGTYGGGLVRYSNGVFTTLDTSDGLTYNMVFCLLEDREGSLWIGTYAGGLNRLKSGLLTTISTSEGLGNDVVFSVFEGGDSSIWIGTEGGGLNRYRNGSISRFTKDDGLSSNNVVSVYGDRSGRLWIGTFGGGLSLFEDGEFTTFSTADGLASDLVFAIYEDSAARIWIGSMGGLNRLDGKRFVSFGESEGFESGPVRCFLEDASGALWIGTDSGLYQLRDGRFTRFTTEHGLGNNTVVSIHEQKDGTLWFGTRGGGLARRVGPDKFASYSRKEGLLADVIFNILEDGRGNFWSGSSKGILRVDGKSIEEVKQGSGTSLRSVLYDKADGMKSNLSAGGSFPSAWAASDGVLWFASTRGVVMVNPASVTSREMTAPPVLVERVLVDRKPVAGNGSQSLPAGSSSFEFEYTALALAAPDTVRFSYQLEPFDGEWVNAGKRRVAYYTNLPPGEYTFHVKAHHVEGLWSSSAASHAFVLRPHFYQTRWFLPLVALALMMLAIAAYRTRVRGLRRRERQLAGLVDDRTEELARANEALMRLSFVDGLTGIANRRELDRVLDSEWRRLWGSGQPVSLVMCDIDFFKDYNDTYGHDKGDACLREVAQAIGGVIVRSCDLAARYGGEEFAVILPVTNPEGALAVAETLRSRVEALGIPHEESRVANVVTISAGVATVHPGPDDPDISSLLRACDRALYRAKAAGRNRIIDARPEIASVR